MTLFAYALYLASSFMKVTLMFVLVAFIALEQSFSCNNLLSIEILLLVVIASS